MARKLTVAVLCLIACLVGAEVAQAGPVFDDYLNYAVVEQRCPASNTGTEGMALRSDGRAPVTQLTREGSLGQTIRMGPKANQLWKIYTGISREGDWQDGETVTFTLWDSVAKVKKLYSRTLDYRQKWHKWDVPFDVHIPTKPNTEYYFEITLSGTGGDGKLAVVSVNGNDYKFGQAYIGGKAQPDTDLYFNILTKPKNDRKDNLKRFLEQFDYSRPELLAAKKSMDKGDLDGACTKVLRSFEADLRAAKWLKLPKPDTKVNTLAMDYVCDQNKLYHEAEKKDEWVEMSDQTTWREAWFETSNFIRQNDLFAELGWDYYLTKNEKYAKKMSGLMLDYAQDNASPFDGGMQSIKFNTMGVGWRLGDAWDGMYRALGSKGFIDDVRLVWIDYNYRMSLHAMKGESGGNQANAVADSLMQFGARFPIYKNAKECFQLGFDKLCKNTLKIFREDGGCVEPAMNYHGFSLATLTSGLDTAKEFGLATPDEVNKKLEKALAYTAYMLKPDRLIPTYGDSDTEEFRPGQNTYDGWYNEKSEAMRCYRMFGREDCLFIASAGKQGKRPEAVSVSFPQTGSYVMRSDWGGEGGKDFDQARYLFLRGGKMGSHGHWDLNEVTLYAYGRPLLLDPGRTNYGTPLMVELSQAQSHNVLLVDGLTMQKCNPTLNSWHTTPVMDFVDNSYDHLYPGVEHRRSVMFVRPDYYVMFDTATASEPRKMGINFWLTPPEVTIDKAAGSVQSNEPAGSNLLLKAMDPSGLEIAERKGTIDLGEIRSDMPVVTYWQGARAKAEFATLMYPLQKDAKAPEIKTTSNGGLHVVETPSGADYLWRAPAIGEMGDGAFGAKARAALVRMDKNRIVTTFALIEGTRLQANTVLAESIQPVSELSVRYLPDVIEVTCPQAEASLEIATLGRTKAVVNGKDMDVSGQKFKPF